VTRPSRQRAQPVSTAAPSTLIYAAALAAVLAGIAAEWLDFRSLRYPILLCVGVGVLFTAHSILGVRTSVRTFLWTVALGVATWAAAESLYVAIHAARGEAFEAERFGPQWVQAFGLIGVHGIFLGLPTGLAAATLLSAHSWIRNRR
jgi:hypothetical protein